MSKRKRVPRVSAAPPSDTDSGIYVAARSRKPGKHVTRSVAGLGATNEELFCWSARKMDHEYRGSWDWYLLPSEIYGFLCFIEDMSKLKWIEILGQGTGGKQRHKKNHSYKIDVLPKEAKDRLDTIFANRDGAEYPEDIFRFRCSGRLRIWGFRVGSLFEILWYDRNHQVYPTAKN